ncbi:MAG: hypothetical protein JO249_14380 [Acidobacteria bacterium]|nr:hypothetical protein [Acidobacteriota bacterium]
MKTSRDQLSILGLPTNDLAPEKKEWLFAGLDAFVNTGETTEDYRRLASQWWTFWPHSIRDGETVDDLDWSPAAHGLFLDYRDKLRKVWKADPEARFSSVLAYLLGIIGRDELLRLEYVLDVDPEWFAREAVATRQAWQTLMQSHPSATMSSHSMAFPLWGLGNLLYIHNTDFERALWVLSQENWRARVCGQCGRHFIANKAAQRYCSTRCFGEAKRGQRLAWWNKAGKIKRSQKKVEIGRIATHGQKPKGKDQDETNKERTRSF